MTAAAPTPDAFTVLTGMADLVAPHALRAAVTLDLPRLIADGARSLDILAERCGADRRALGSLTAYLVHKGVLATTPEGLALTPVGQLLTTDQARLMLAAGGAAQELGRAWPGLAHAVRTGTSGYRAEIGRDFWETLDRDPDLSAAFDRYMENWGRQWIPNAVAARDWPADGHVVDVGGGAGQLLTALLTAHPGLKGSVVDLPAAARRAREALAAAGLSDSGGVFEGSFFDPLPAHGDLYVLAQVLHDWPDVEASRILRRCAEAAGPDGRVLVIERVMGDPPSLAHVTSDLFMLVLFGARERTRAEFDALAGEASLEIVEIRDLGFGLSTVELRPGADGAG